MREDLLVRRLSDNQLISALKKFRNCERKVQSRVLMHLGEIERRKLYAVRGYSSLFNYVISELGYSEASALKRIQVARAAMRFPTIYSLVEKGMVSLTALMKLCPYLKASNWESLLESIQKKSVREVERILSEKFPTPEPPDSVKCLSKDRVWFSFAADQEFAKQLKEAKERLRHRYPEGRLKDIFSEALNSLLQREEKKKKAVRIPKPTQASSRHIPQHVKAAVWKRDEGSCSFISPEGRRCGERGFLEYDHKLPWSLGGRSDDVNNIRLLCRTHNRLMADQLFGTAYIQKKIDEKYQGFERKLYMNRFMLERFLKVPSGFGRCV